MLKCGVQVSNVAAVSVNVLCGSDFLFDYCVATSRTTHKQNQAPIHTFRSCSGTRQTALWLVIPVGGV